MYRIPRAVHFMNLAAEHAKRSTCFRLNVGCLISHGKDIVALAHNGPPSGEPHCFGSECAGAATGCTRAVHAEMNAIGSRNLMEYPSWSLDIFITHSPCRQCTERMIQLTVFRRVFYQTEFRDPVGLNLLHSKDIGVYKITPAGYVTKFPTLELVDPAGFYT